MSIVTNSTTITVAKPRIPLRSVVETMHQGMTTLALRISSAIYNRSLLGHPSDQTHQRGSYMDSAVGTYPFKSAVGS